MQEKKNNFGSFIISLDFEIYWGVRDKKSIEDYKENLLGVQNVIPKLLNLSNQYNVNLTFSTVGMLFNNNKNELLLNNPKELPTYKNQNFSPYSDNFNNVKNSEVEDPFHFAHSLIMKIKNNPHHEIGTHTYSHYYCLEDGQNIDQFEADLIAAKNIAIKNNINIESIVFPRNQLNESYLKTCKKLGINSYRGNPKAWIYKAGDGTKETYIKRIIRLVDTYFNIYGHHCFSNPILQNDLPMNIPASMFLRPFNSKLKFIDFLKLNRIKKAMTYAAKNNLSFHLWWHPHNFGKNQNENFYFLEKIYSHYEKLNKLYNFKSQTMNEYYLTHQ